jgi:thioredoxin reductase (NADPH)
MDGELIYDVIVVGSGPAGLSAAIYTSRAHLRTLVIAGVKWGGQLMITGDVENFPGFPDGIKGPELMERMRKQAERFGVVVMDDDAVEVQLEKRPFSVKTSRGAAYAGESVIVATGAEARWLGLPNEQRLIGRGVSSCAPCDAPFFMNKKVAVIGGGDAAMEESVVLTKFASEVTVVHRKDSFRASKIMQDRVLHNDKIKIVWDTEILDVLGEDRVTGLQVKNIKTGEVRELPVEGVFVAIGHSPSTKMFQGKIETDAKGYIKRIKHDKFKMLNENGEEIGYRYNTMTSMEGVFVAGDVHDIHYKQAITAAGYGCQAALEVEKWLADQKS